jgi:DNA-binding HxlR family transcriptional regulator
MKSYNQACPTARALDVIGDRWRLLVLRELLIQGPCRYTDLAKGLPGIATSVLADRLRSLEESGLIRREAAPPPIATTLFHLTDEGRAVEPILVTLGRWGVEHLDGPGPDAEVQFHWFPWAASLYLRSHAAEGLPLVIQLETPIGSGVVEVRAEGVRPRVGTATSPDLTIRGTPQSIIEFLSGKASLAESRSCGVTLEGNVGILADFSNVVAS